MTGLQVGLVDLAGRRLHPARPTGAVTLEVGRRGTSSLSLDVSCFDAAAGDVASAAVAARAWIDGRPVFGGPISRPRIDFTGGTVTVQAVGVRARLEAWQLGQRSDGAGLAGHAAGRPWRLEQVDEADMLARLVSHAIVTPAEAAAGVQPLGVDIGGIVPTGQVRDREWEAGKQIAEAMDQLADVIDGPDWTIRPVDDEATPEVLGRLDAGPALGRDLTGHLMLEDQVGSNNCRVVHLPGGSDAGTLVNRGTAVGETPPYDGDGTETAPPPAPVGRAEQRQSQALHGVYCRFDPLQGVSDVDTVARTVGALVSQEAWPVDHVEVAPDPGALRPMPPAPGRDWEPGDVWVGDLVRVRAVAGFCSLDTTATVTGLTCEQDVDGTLTTRLTLAPVARHSTTS